MYRHRFNARATSSLSHRELLNTLRVVVNPDRALGVDARITFIIDGDRVPVHIRNCVAVIDDAEPAATITMTRDTLNKLVSNKVALSAVLASGEVAIAGDRDVALTALAVYEVDGFHS